MDTEFSAARPVAQLALRPDFRAEVEALLRAEGLGYSAVDRDRLLETAQVEMASPAPILIDLSGFELSTDETLRDLLSKIAAQRRLIAILDATLVDRIGPLLDVPYLNFVAWPCETEAFMAVLQPIDVEGLLKGPEPDEEIDLARLREEVGRIAQALSVLAERTCPADADHMSDRTPAESAALIRSIIQRRRARASFFPSELFADPGWDILLDLAAARLEGKRVSISSLCIAAAVPTTTALRWIKNMTEAGMLERHADPHDGRRSFITLSKDTAAMMERYLNLTEGKVA